MPSKRIDIFGLGQCSLDYIGQIDAYPPPDVKCEFSGMVIQSGGPVASAMVALARWGLSCVFSGTIGDDFFGGMITESLTSAGVDTSGLVIRKSYASQFAFIAVEPGQGRRTIFWQRPTGQPVQPEEIDANKLRQACVFHTDGLFIDAALHAARIAKNAGIPVVVDAGTLREGMMDLALLSDSFIASEIFAQALTGSDDAEAACRMISETGVGLACITLGEKGYIALARGKHIRKPAYPVHAIDTTGCGDAFHAGYTYGLARGWNEEKRLDFGAWAAAQVSLQMGGRMGIPDLNAVKIWISRDQ